MRMRCIMVMLVLVPAMTAAQTKPAVKPADFGKWETLGAGVLAPNGQWVAYGISRVNEETELRLRALERDTTIVIANATGAVFTPDSKWIAYSIGVPPATRERLEREKKPVRNALGLRNLATLQVDTVADVAAFRFSTDGKHLAMRRYPAEGKRAADVIVQNLATRARTTLGNVVEYGWSDRRPLLAVTIETDGGAGNGVQLFDAATSVLRVLDSSPALYRALVWRPKSVDLVVLRTQADKAFKDTTHAVIAWNTLDGPSSTSRTLDPGASIAADLGVSEARRPVWSKDGSILFIGLRPRIRAPEPPLALKSDGSPSEKTSDVQVWHSRDVRLLRAQEVQEQQDLQRTFLAAWHLSDGKVTRIGSDLMETTTVLEGARFAMESDRKGYAWGQMFGRPYQDLWSISTVDGQRTKALEKVRYTYGGSPSGNKLVWYDGKDYWSYDVGTGNRINLSARAGGDFADPDYDTPTDVRPASGFLGWTRGEKNVLVYDKYDIWSLAADGTGGRRLTNGAPEKIVYRYARITPDEEGIDLSKPVILTMLGERTKKFGFARLKPGKAAEPLIFTDERVTQLIKADSADVFAYTRENFNDAPDWFTGTQELGKARQVSAVNAFQQDYAWGKSELVDFTSAAGRPLQAALYYPANYDPSRKYPMIVYTYELLSENVHNYVVPSERRYYNKAVWTANGYFVLEPDIVFRGREPGIAVLEAVEPAVRAITARGIVDSTKVGHIGHSWGGYEATFLPTRTRIFAAGVAGAAITNFLSFNGSVHWTGGNAEYSHWETGQARMDVPPWEDLDAYLRNSPIAKIQDLKSPLLVMTGDADGTVEWHQSMEFYQSARRAGRQDLVMLLYPGEDHSLRKKENQIDYHRRINQWFGHYLKGEPAPKWITDGTSWLERKAGLESNK